MSILKDRLRRLPLITRRNPIDLILNCSTASVIKRGSTFRPAWTNCISKYHTSTRVWNQDCIRATRKNTTSTESPWALETSVISPIQRTYLRFQVPSTKRITSNQLATKARRITPRPSTGSTTSITSGKKRATRAWNSISTCERRRVPAPISIRTLSTCHQRRKLQITRFREEIEDCWRFRNRGCQVRVTMSMMLRPLSRELKMQRLQCLRHQETCPSRSMAQSMPIWSEKASSDHTNKSSKH